MTEQEYNDLKFGDMLYRKDLSGEYKFIGESFKDADGTRVCLEDKQIRMHLHIPKKEVLTFETKSNIKKESSFAKTIYSILSIFSRK